MAWIGCWKCAASVRDTDETCSKCGAPISQSAREAHAAAQVASQMVSLPDGTRMRKCPFCAELIQPDAKICRFCQRDVASTAPGSSGPLPPLPPENAPRQSNAGRLIGLGCLGLVGVFLLLGIIGSLLPDAPSSSRTGPRRANSTAPPAVSATAAPAPEARAPETPAYDLALLSARGTDTGHGYFTVEGQVRNLSGKPIENVTAVATWYDGDGQFITSDDALIEYNPILPGQTSPFRTMTRGNPEMKRFTVEFKTLFGRALPTQDLRK